MPHTRVEFPERRREILIALAIVISMTVLPTYADAKSVGEVTKYENLAYGPANPDSP